MQTTDRLRGALAAYQDRAQQQRGRVTGIVHRALVANEYDDDSWCWDVGQLAGRLHARPRLSSCEQYGARWDIEVVQRPRAQLTDAERRADAWSDIAHAIARVGWSEAWSWRAESEDIPF